MTERPGPEALDDEQRSCRAPKSPAKPSRSPKPPSGSCRWVDYVLRLKDFADREAGVMRPRREQVVTDTLTMAVDAAKADPQWRDSSLPERLERARQMDDSAAAAEAALQLMDFHRIVSRNAGQATPETELSTAGSSEEVDTSILQSIPMPPGIDCTSLELAAKEVSRSARLVTSGSNPEPAQRDAPLGTGSTLEDMRYLQLMSRQHPNIVLRAGGQPAVGPTIVLSKQPSKELATAQGIKQEPSAQHATAAAGRVTIHMRGPDNAPAQPGTLGEAGAMGRRRNGRRTEGGGARRSRGRPGALPASLSPRSPPSPALLGEAGAAEAPRRPWPAPGAMSSAAPERLGPDCAGSGGPACGKASPAAGRALPSPFASARRGTQPPAFFDLAPPRLARTEAAEPKDPGPSSTERLAGNLTGSSRSSAGHFDPALARASVDHLSAERTVAGTRSGSDSLAGERPDGAPEARPRRRHMEGSGSQALKARSEPARATPEAEEELSDSGDSNGAGRGQVPGATPREDSLGDAARPLKKRRIKRTRSTSAIPPAAPQCQRSASGELPGPVGAPRVWRPGPAFSAPHPPAQVLGPPGANNGTARATPLSHAVDRGGHPVTPTTPPRTALVSALAAAALVAPRPGSGSAVSDAMLFVERGVAPGPVLARAAAERQRSAEALELTPELAIAPLRLDSPAAALPTSPGGASRRNVVWVGKVKHRLGTAAGHSTVELLNLSALVPEDFLEQLPPSLFVTELAARSAVHMGIHTVVQCRLGFLSERQLAKLQVLATSKLVAVCQLQHCRIVFVPHLDRRTGGGVGVIGFLIPDDILIASLPTPAPEGPAAPSTAV